MSIEPQPLFSKEEFISSFGLKPGELTDALFDYTTTITMYGEWQQRVIGRRRFAETVARALRSDDSEERTGAVEALILSNELSMLISNLMRH